MDLFGRFQEFITEVIGVVKGDKILLAVSGGRDSMLMARLFLELGYPCVIAHCNFALRGEASDLDESLVRTFAQENKVPFAVRRFETETFAQAQGISIQMAARALRYEWFEMLREEHGARWIAVAQHQNDHIETVLLNLTRGTGLRGLRGILPRRNRLIRPLLFLTAEEVTFYVDRLKVPYRDDESNFSTKYARNKIRLDIIPRFKEIVPDFEVAITQNISHFQEAYDLLQSFVKPLRKQLLVEKDGDYRIDRKLLQPYLANLPLLFEIFKPFGFSKAVLADLQKSVDGNPGKRFLSDTHEMLLDRNAIWMVRLTGASVEARSRDIHPEEQQLQFGGKDIHIRVEENLEVRAGAYQAQLDMDTLKFPLYFRFWKEGDYFYPLGMQGKKKLSDFFIQEKVALHKKKCIPILVDAAGHVVWIVGYRLDNRYKISESTKKVFTLVCK